MTPSPLLPPHCRPSSSSPLRSSSSPLKRTSPTEDVAELLELCRCHLPLHLVDPWLFARAHRVRAAPIARVRRRHRVPAVAASGAPLPCPPAAPLSRARLCLGRARVLAARIHACRRCPHVMLRHCGRPRPSIPPLALLAVRAAVAHFCCCYLPLAPPPSLLLLHPTTALTVFCSY